MGVGGEKKPMREISATQQASRDEAFEAIIEKLRSAGAQIEEDEVHPLYTDVGEQEFEIGSERIVRFDLNNTNFLLVRKVETHSLQGQGLNKHIEPHDPPRTHISLKRKAPLDKDWQVVDLEDMF